MERITISYEKQEAYFVVNRGTSEIVKCCDSNSESNLSDAYKYCLDDSKSALALGYAVVEFDVLSKSEFIDKYGEDAIGYAEV